MFEKMIFYLFAFTLFILMFLKLLRKNDTTYVYAIVLQFIGIVIRFLELIFNKNCSVFLKILSYIISVILPILIFWLEYSKKIEFSEVFFIWSARMYVYIGKVENAKKCLLELTEKYPDSIKGHKLLARVYEKQKNFELALEEYEKVANEDENNSSLILKLSQMYNYIGRQEIAIENLSKILRKNPECYEASMLLADILSGQREYKEAVQVYMNALKHKPFDYNLYYNLGMTYTFLNDFSKAKEYYEKAAKLNGSLYHARYSLGKINLLYGDLEEAEKYFMECIDVEEIESGAYYYLARIAMIKGQTEKAKNYVNIAIEEDAKIYDKVYDENIFAPIIDLINKPKIKQEEKKKGKRNTLTGKEKTIDAHLDDTCRLVGKLNNSDIEVIENMKKTRQQEFLNKSDNSFNREI